MSSRGDSSTVSRIARYESPPPFPLPAANRSPPELIQHAPLQLASYLSAIISLQSISLLGIGDDLFDIRWRHKFFIPAFASIPLLVIYFVDFGVTSIVIPIPLQPYLGELFNLGALYYVYMAGVAIFSPNSINILAGINGIEVSQSIVIASPPGS